jgi:hypothetical protein
VINRAAGADHVRLAIVRMDVRLHGEKEPEE